MVWTRDFRASTITVDTGGAAIKTVRGITSSSGRLQTEIDKEINSANVYPDTVIVSAVRPMCTFTTIDIVGAIDALGLLGLCIESGVGDEGLAIYTQKQDCSGIAAGSVHDQYLINKGVAVPRTLTVDHRGNAQLTYEIYAVYDGVNDPIVRTETVPLPTVASTPVGRWTMRSMTVAGTAVEGKRNITIDFGSSVTQEGADSLQFDTVSSIASISPVVTVRGVDTSWFDGVVPIEGVACTLANTIMQLQKRGVAIGSAVHATIAFNGVATINDAYDATPTAPAEMSLQVDCAYDGTNAPLSSTINTILT